MSKATVCDNLTCQNVASDYNDQDPQLDWLNVGWLDGPRFDACSPECAHKLIDHIEARSAEIAAEIAAEDAALAPTV